MYWLECFWKWWYPRIIHFNRVFHYKPSILGYPYFWKHPFSWEKNHLFFKLRKGSSPSLRSVGQRLETRLFHKPTLQWEKKFTPLLHIQILKKNKFTSRKTTTQKPQNIPKFPLNSQQSHKIAQKTPSAVTDLESQQISSKNGELRGVGCLLFFQMLDRSPNAHPASFYSQSFLGLKKQKPHHLQRATGHPSTPQQSKSPTNLGGFLFQKLQLGVDRVLFGL